MLPRSALVAHLFVFELDFLCACVCQSRTLEAHESFKLRHGEAVAIDCVMSTMIAKGKNWVSANEAQEVMYCTSLFFVAELRLFYGMHHFVQVLDLYALLKLPCSIKGITAET